MELFERFEELSRVIDQMNEQAVQKRDVPYVRLHDYVHYCDVQTFFHAYTRRLRLPLEKEKALFDFCYRDTLERKSEIGQTDLYAFTYHYFKNMTYRTGNLDTPDDCVEKLDLDLFDYYVDKLANFIIKNDAKVKNHYETILKWWREDSKIGG